MVPDLQTSMKELREANADFVQLLTHLKQFVSANGSVTLNVGGVDYTFPTIPELIAQYRDGTFDTVTVEAGGKKAILSMHDGTLKIADGDGNLVELEVAKLKYSSIESCSLGNVTVDDCSIEKLTARDVIAEKADVASFKAQELDASTVMAQSLNAAQLEADRASVGELRLGRLVFAPRATMDMFMVAGREYNYKAGNVVFVPVGPYSKWKCSTPTPEELAAGYKAPETMGFAQLPLSSSNGAWVRTAPDMVAFHGDTVPAFYLGDPLYLGGRAGKVINFYVMGTGPMGAQAIMNAGQTRVQGGSIGDSTISLAFARALAWPLKSYAPNPSAYDGFPTDEDAEGLGLLHEVSASDIGHIVCYRTGAHQWTVPRVLEVKYVDGQPVESALGSPYDVPAYSCICFRLNRYASAGDGYTIYKNVLELV